MRELGPVDLEGMQVIAINEFAIHKGHLYASVIVEPYRMRMRVLWLALGWAGAAKTCCHSST